MALETSLRTLLLAQSSITTLVSSRDIGGTTYYAIFNENPEEGFAPPYILIHLIDFDAMGALDGTTGMTSYEIDIDCYSTKVSASLAIADAVHSFLKDYTGAAGSDTIDAVFTLNKRMDDYPEGQGRKVFHNITSLSYQIQAH